jgi:hypothetical protein
MYLEDSIQEAKASDSFEAAEREAPQYYAACYHVLDSPQKRIMSKILTPGEDFMTLKVSEGRTSGLARSTAQRAFTCTKFILRLTQAAFKSSIHLR